MLSKIKKNNLKMIALIIVIDLAKNLKSNTKNRIKNNFKALY